MYFVHPSTDISVKCQLTYQPMLDRYVGRYVDQHSANNYIGRDVSADILTDISTEISVDISADTRPICRSICRTRVVLRQSADMLIDRLPTFRRYLTATCIHSTSDCSLSSRHNLTLVSDLIC